MNSFEQSLRPFIISHCLGSGKLTAMVIPVLLAAQTRNKFPQFSMFLAVALLSVILVKRYNAKKLINKEYVPLNEELISFYIN